MSIDQGNNTLTRSILTRTLKTVGELAVTLDDLLLDEKATSSNVERLQQLLKEEVRKCENLKGLIEATRSSKAKMEMVAHELECMLSPMKTLPTEILIKIFATVIDTENAERQLRTSNWSAFKPDLTPLFLSQVCARWRHILTLNHALWEHIEFYSTTDAVQQFDRSTKHGFGAQQSLFVPSWEEDKHSHLLSKLGVLSSPLKAIELDVWEDPEGVWDAEALNAHEVVIYRPYHIQTINYFMPLLRMASKLTIHGNPPRWGRVPWPSLQTLIIRLFCGQDHRQHDEITFTRDDFAQLVKATPSLNRLELDFRVEDTGPVHEDDIKICHTGIKYLSIHLHHLTQRKGLLGIHLDLPALQVLEFLSLRLNPAPINEEEPIFSGLHPLRLVLPDMERHMVIVTPYVIDSLPSIERLDLVGPSYSISNLNSLHPSNGHDSPPANSVPMPNLRTLHITDSGIDGETLTRFVQARLELCERQELQISAIESIHMYNTPAVTASDWNKIQEILEGGRVANNKRPSVV